jgi:hypothetical protein
MRMWKFLLPGLPVAVVYGQVIQLQLEAVESEDGGAEAVDAVVVVVLPGEQVIGLLIEMTPESRPPKASTSPTPCHQPTSTTSLPAPIQRRRCRPPSTPRRDTSSRRTPPADPPWAYRSISQLPAHFCSSRAPSRRRHGRMKPRGTGRVTYATQALDANRWIIGHIEQRLTFSATLSRVEREPIGLVRTVER